MNIGLIFDKKTVNCFPKKPLSDGPIGYVDSNFARDLED